MNFLINNKYIPKRLQEKIYTYLRGLVKLRSSSRAISLGVAIGIFVAVTPTIGLQIFIAAFLSSICNANRPAAIIFVWTTNPITFPFVYGFTYWVGNLFWSGPPLFKVKEILMKTDHALDKGEVWHFYDRLKTILALWRNIFIPLTIGGIIVGAVAGGIAYLITLRVILYCKKHFRHTHHEDT
ncbi:putative membrane protein [Candidatus Kuenenia stuttgartiensis]|uniref:Putative membrane protein n=1 Tax=Kuenenia stuttgartiensis TaxID=174633 RepID=Q1PV04_KUEST|nr:DUF2062 domain-containing protein [Candidatus Kuenenia stuttgartiensis]MBE7546216.1 DUF2062 domain-containing protein [Planctomycetia bacterium]QII09532.1 putative membrane protein [Candidatus Kuenenia stuttgartiensis]CAJ71049.1 conserved hypothetical protein [Candidatus Kuenenia stuttgartiensis]SOH04519.1 hypothetical protein KSMBR1_2021 [Candidatus Kuenenia stuttgartiensis]GJQ50270.1 MAG: hypothetical protein HKUEN01_26560 [Candidatus Kuenenia stuttgartiensis]